MDEQDLLRKVGGLLAKAEGTDNEHEANAFFEKAHELMVRYAIDEARVRESQRKVLGRQIEEPVLEEYMLSSYAHHATAKLDLLVAVAKHHSVRVWPYPNDKGSNWQRVQKAGLTGLHESQWARLVGYKTDIETVKLLYLSLLIQAQRFAQADWRNLYGEAKHSSFDDGHVGKFSWISTHMGGFAARIGERFAELTEVIYTEVPDGKSLIFDKNANIQEWIYQKGYQSRPNPNAMAKYKPRCYAEGFPPEVKVRANSIPYYCMLDEGHNEGPNPTPHIYSQKQQRSYSSWSGSGRTTSYGAGEHGRAAANRADIGLSRVGSTSRAIRG